MQQVNRAAAAAGVLALAGLVAALPAQAGLVYSGPVNLAVPNTTAGLYVNVLNGSSFSGPGTFPVLGGPGANYDFNIFGASAWTLFSPTASGQSAPSVPTTSRGYVSATTTGAASSLTFGTVIDGSSVFNTGSPSGAGLSTGQPVYFGFRFRNEGPDLSTAADDTVHFGWAQVILSPGTPGTLIDYAFESTPLTGIQVGVVPEPAAWLLMALGVAALLARQRRQPR
ncbi:MAG: PEP-CTERM sorting domain-containing protein [Rubrivivax sp.]|nr:PEP-CTERM sorting domain-containing protein [Rubrivivax sp.]